MLYDIIRDSNAKRIANRLAVILHLNLIAGYPDMSNHNIDHGHERILTRSQRPAIDVMRHKFKFISMEFVNVCSGIQA